MQQVCNKVLIHNSLICNKYNIYQPILAPILGLRGSTEMVCIYPSVYRLIYSKESKTISRINMLTSFVLDIVFILSVLFYLAIYEMDKKEPHHRHGS